MDPLRPDLSAALTAWGDRVRANAAQVERYREQVRRADHYAPLVQNFQLDPRRQGDPTVDALLALARPDETWLDVGSGAGRYALPLALRATWAADALWPDVHGEARATLPALPELLALQLARRRVFELRMIETRP